MSGLRSLGEHVAQQQDAALEMAERSEATRRALAERAAARSQPRIRPWRRFTPALAAAALLGGVAGVVVSAGALFHEDELTFTVGDTARPGVLGAWEHAPRDGVLPIRFSDGTAVRLQPDARARVVRVSPRGADVVIESGRALVEVVPKEQASWLVQSGPFVVAVKGTRFEVGWNPRKDELTLQLFEGRVVVTGCGLGEGRSVKAGEQLVTTCGRDTLAAGLAPEAAASRPASAALATETAESMPEAAATTATAAAPAGPHAHAAHAARASGAAAETWRGLAHAGHYARAYELAAAAGFEAECERASAEDTLMLGDAARLNGRAQHAHHAYSSVRRRFAGSAAAARAAFELGRSAFQSGNTTGAVRWFETYVAEQPSGPLAAAAYERLLEASLQLGDRARSRSIAAAYLAKFPAGPHAREAHRILGRVEPAKEP